MNERKGNLFKQVPAPKVSRNLFDLSHEVKMSGKFGFLYPILCCETLPGDNFRDTMNCFLRFAPLLSPVMHRCDVTSHFFFVPNRLLTDVWESFITGGQDGTEEPVLPYVTAAGLYASAPEFIQKGSVWDYLGLPVHVSGGSAPTSTERISVLPFRALGKIWNDYYRDPNFDDEIDLHTDLEGNVNAVTVDGNAEIVNPFVFRRAYEKDYFTSALPWAQRGTQVLLPMSVVVDRAVLTATGEPVGASGDIMHNINSFLLTDVDGTPPPGGAQIHLIGDNAETTINDFKRALAVQQWMESNARGGARYVEQIEGHFDVRVPDYRLQRAEYLGGGKQPVQITEVLATGGGSVGLGDAPVGEMSGHGISVGRTNRFSYRCEEHGFVVGFLSVTMRTAYFQGIPKMFSRDDKFDYAWPELAHLGEQEILSKELFYSFVVADDDNNNAIFGYTPRYSEYKFQNDRVAGDFRDNLGFWHLSRNFLTRPILGATFTGIHEEGDAGGDFIEEDMRRIFAVQDGTDYLWMQLYHHLTVKRPLPYFGVPRII